MADENGEELESATNVPAEPTAEGFASRLIAQAKRAGGQVQASAADLTHKVGDLKDQAGVAASELGDLTAAKLGELKEAGLSVLVEALADFNAALPAAREAGYALQGINVALALPPRVTATFTAPGDVTAEKIERVLAEHVERRFTVALIKSLYQASRVQNKVHVGGLKPSSLSVLIGVPPSVTINFD